MRHCLIHDSCERWDMPLKYLKLAFFCVFPAAAAVAAKGTSPLALLREQDERLLRIVEPLLTDNLALCDRTIPRLGVALQSIDQYPPDAPPAFAAPVAFAAILPGS